MAEIKNYAGNYVFGLDIGTRSIVGTVGYQKDDQFIVLAQRVKEHDTRAMIDGQIHDIGRVGATIQKVKEALEEALNITLTDVCIAAAGRVLRTINIHVDYHFEEDKIVTTEDIYALNSLGIEKAYDEFNVKNNSEIKFYCVGYSIIKYYLNDYPMGNLENHKGKTISADMIATFLPDDVVDGLYKAVEIAGLKVANLTLEPIAAIQVAIPEMYRMLNIALIDVGAGTSDISITKDGSIIAYGMISTAGDCLTEVLAKHCLVDFVTADQIKKDSENKELIEYKDIMGLTQKISVEEVRNVLESTVRGMTKQVADKLKELNGEKSVSAVFVVGGGGKIEGYTKLLAKELDIAPERVALRGEEVMQKIIFMEEDTIKDSLMVTPIGICLCFYEESNNFIYVNFNNQRIKLYDNKKLAVVDAAMQANFPNDGLFPRRGRELNFTINHKSRIVRGKLGEAAVITVNGETADLYMPIQSNDRVVVTRSSAGEPAMLEIKDLPEYKASLEVIVNDQKISLPKFALVNGSLKSGYYNIQENDDIMMLNEYTVKQIVDFMDVSLNQNMNIYVNNKLADFETKVYENFSVIWTMECEENQVINSEVKQNQEVDGSITVSVNGNPVTMTGKDSYIFVDVFDYIDFDLSKPQGKGIITNVNGNKTQYMDALKNGDIIDIYWS
ncbi:MAG TPA: cell division FtsA domain-containing protein [Lachnospiraceae bacterium]|nr:cell division FtsA domain-containing protein [Lachnospiraceae bacterium]